MPRRALLCSVSAGESELHWRSFFESLVARGIRGGRVMTTAAWARHDGRFLAAWLGNVVSFIYNKTPNLMFLKKK